MKGTLPASLDASSNPNRAAGWTLLAVTAGEILAMAHHPSVARSDVAGVLGQMNALARPDRIVHGALIAMMLLLGLALTDFVRWRGAARPSMRAGAIAYGTGILTMTGAALFNGFVAPALAASLPRADAADLHVAHGLLILCGIVAETCADTATIALSAGIVVWSFDLLATRGAARLVGLAGCTVGLVPAVALIGGALRLDVHGMQEVVLAQGAWQAGIGLLLIRAGRRAPATMP